MIAALLALCVQSVGAFAPAPHLVLRSEAAAGSCSAQSRRSALHCVMMTAGERSDRREVLESGKKMALLSLIAPLLQATSVGAFSVPAGAMQGGKVGEMPSVLQGAVLQCENLEDELAFWTQGLKMKVLRRVGGSVVVGYGSESLVLEKGGHFSLELVQARAAVTASAPKLKVEMVLPARTNLIIDGEEAGGRLEPAWFGTSGYIVFSSPSGFLVRIETTKEKEVAYPIKAVAIQTDDVGAMSASIGSMLKMQPDDGFQLPFSSPKAKTFRFFEKEGVAQNVALIIEPLDAPPPAQMSKAALLKKKQEEAKLAEEEGDQTANAKGAAQSNFVLSLVSDDDLPATSATPTGLR